jgi:hypothetical protein
MSDDTVVDPIEIDGRFRPVKTSHVVGVELDGEAVLYQEAARTLHLLNQTATVIWNCLDGVSDLDSLADDLAAAFSADVQRVRDDVLEVVRQFGRQGLLKQVAPDPEVVASHVLTPLEGQRKPDA